MKIVKLFCLLITCCSVAVCSSCKKLISVKQQAGNDNIIFDFKNDSEANAAVVGIYEQMSTTTSGFATGRQSISLLAGLSADELNCYSTDENFNQFYINDISPSNTSDFILWQTLYKVIYQCNSVLSALQNNALITPSFSRQLEGEALFFRSYFYFYLVNLYGAIPISLQTDYTTNSTLLQARPKEVYSQINRDLINATGLLSNEYILSGERIRVNASGARALLSRLYLYTKQYPECIDEASQVIAQTNKYQLCSQLDMVFLKNSSEAILQLQPVHPGYNTWDAEAFILPVSPFLVAISNNLLGQFDYTDLRLQQWISHATISGTSYSFPFKYRHRHPEAQQEYLMLLRLAEQYLNRAEAYAMQGMFEKSLGDLNTIRSRAALPPLYPVSKEQLLQAIMTERRKELFTEWGHRWLDLKRTGTADSVLAPLKGTFKPFAQHYPIPASEILLNPHLVQNNGY